ncbi:MAG: hypothetical protein J6D37_02710 [Clostridia bacterium]|nr:hypothetical protein [Clostridia bacterium]
MKKRKISLIIASLLMCLLMALSMGACANKKSEKKTITGEYHVGEVNSVKRGCDIIVMLNADGSIYTIAEDEESDYVISVGGPWGIFNCLTFYPNLCSCSVEEINSWKVTCDENGLPVSIEGMPSEWLIPANTDACGMVILALQDAFAQI